MLQSAHCGGDCLTLPITHKSIGAAAAEADADADAAAAAAGGRTDFTCDRPNFVPISLSHRSRKGETGVMKKGRSRGRAMNTMVGISGKTLGVNGCAALARTNDSVTAAADHAAANASIRAMAYTQRAERT
jgi:hypothetical protein